MRYPDYVPSYYGASGLTVETGVYILNINGVN